MNDTEYALKFQPEVTNVLSVARKFCTEHGAMHGFTEQTLNNCIVPVAEYVQSAIDSSKAQAK